MASEPKETNCLILEQASQIGDIWLLAKGLFEKRRGILFGVPDHEEKTVLVLLVEAGRHFESSDKVVSCLFFLRLGDPEVVLLSMECLPSFLELS